jgi:hypothetical protein
MIDMLVRGDTDVALAVTDALLVANRNKRQVQLAGVYCTSPLIWAAAAHPSSKFFDLKEFITSKLEAHKSLRIGVSRLGSGSHTMACYMAMQHGLATSDLSFHVANTFQGLRDGVKNDSFDVFLWETFTTKPFFDSLTIAKALHATNPHK